MDKIDKIYKVDINNMICVEQLQCLDINQLTDWNIDGIWKWDSNSRACKNEIFLYGYLSYVIDNKVVPSISSLNKLINKYCKEIMDNRSSSKQDQYFTDTRYTQFYMGISLKYSKQIVEQSNLEYGPITLTEWIYENLISNISWSILAEIRNRDFLMYFVDKYDYDQAKIGLLFMNILVPNFTYPQNVIDTVFSSAYTNEQDIMMQRGLIPSSIIWEDTSNYEKLRIYVKYVKPPQQIFDQWVKEWIYGFHNSSLRLVILESKMQISQPIINLPNKPRVLELYNQICPPLQK
jgi:hypothetical protein